MMKRAASIVGLISLFLWSGLMVGWRQISRAAAERIPQEEIRRRVASLDEEAILAAGLRTDAESIPQLRRIATQPAPTDKEIAERLGLTSMSDPESKREIEVVRTGIESQA